ncbi:hypothetical protein B484DRAFT_459854 [Ochromonadaceae sp. CCMP2298]|nr:hypothetical protein B484DRAFT_459854 [Ochromonadaceae sp. CCMP2298]
MGGGEPMLMLRGMGGGVGAVALDQPAPSPGGGATMGLGSPYQQQGQQGQARPESYSPHGGGHPSFGDQGMGGGMGHGMGQGMGGVGSSQEGKYPLNREFSDVLERGSLSDIAHLLEGTPRPEQLSISVRNRLYDAVATLLQQNSHAERALIWTLALVRGAGLGEVAGHTRRDLQEALEQLAQEPSKRGLLASLIRSQLRR